MTADEVASPRVTTPDLIIVCYIKKRGSVLCQLPYEIINDLTTRMNREMRCTEYKTFCPIH